MFEEFYRGPLGEAAAAFRSPDPGEAPQAVKRKRPEAVVRGEVTLLIEGHRKEHEEEISEDDITAQLLALRERGASVSDVRTPLLLCALQPTFRVSCGVSSFGVSVFRAFQVDIWPGWEAVLCVWFTS